MIEKMKNLDLVEWLLLGIIILVIMLIPYVFISSNKNNNKNETACYDLQARNYETVWLDYTCFIKTDVGWFAMNSPDKESDYDALIPLLLINSFD
jgi:hypothetical protein